MFDPYFFRRVPAQPVSQPVGATPVTYTNESQDKQLLTVSGGIVSLIEVDAGLGYLPAIGVGGTYLLFPDQSIRINYAVSAPTLSMIQL